MIEMQFCEFCGGAIYPDDLAPLKLKSINGETYRAFYHNRNNRDCLIQKIEELRRYFASQEAAPQN